MYAKWYLPVCYLVLDFHLTLSKFYLSIYICANTVLDIPFFSGNGSLQRLCGPEERVVCTNERGSSHVGGCGLYGYV